MTAAATHDVPLFAHQLAVLQAATRDVYLVAGAGAGKTRVGCIWALTLCLANPAGTAGMIVAPTYPVLRQSTMRAFLDVLAEFGIPHTRNKADNVVTIHGRTIFFRSADKPESLVGADLAWLWLDEGALMDAMVYTRAAQRIRDPRATRRQLLVTSTPEGTGTWLHKREGLPEVTVVRASTLDNKALDAGTIDNLRSIYANDPAGWRQYVEGIATDMKGNIYVGLSAANVVPFAELPGHGVDIVLGWDFNVHWMATVVGAYVHRTSTLHIVGEVVTRSVSGTTTIEHAERVRRALVDSGACEMLAGRCMTANAGEHVRAYIDASGRQQRSSATWTDEVAVHNAGFSPRAPASNPAVRDRIATVNAALTSRRLLIDPVRAPETLKAIRDHAYDKHGDPQKTWTRDDFQADHFCDAVGYMAWSILPQRLKRAHEVLS